MVCAKCQKVMRSTTLATPNVKRKSELYYGSPASTSSTTAGKSKTSATLGNTGVSKNKLLSKNAKNPYASYASKCKTCNSKIEQGRTYCHGCAYKANSCAMCGKSQTKDSKASGIPVVQGQKFSAK